MDSSNAGFFAIVAVLALVAFGGAAQDIAPNTPPERPLPATTLDLSRSFATNGDAAQRREHASELRRVFAITTAGVEWDGRQPEGERAFRDGSDLDHHIVTVRKFFAEEWRFRDVYPDLGNQVAEFLKGRLGDHLHGALTDDGRRAWVSALGEIQAAALAVERG